jgi:hypothetical protein
MDQVFDPNNKNDVESGIPATKEQKEEVFWSSIQSGLKEGSIDFGTEGTGFWTGADEERAAKRKRRNRLILLLIVILLVLGGAAAAIVVVLGGNDEAGEGNSVDASGTLFPGTTAPTPVPIDVFTPRPTPEPVGPPSTSSPTSLYQCTLNDVLSIIVFIWYFPFSYPFPLFFCCSLLQVKFVVTAKGMKLGMIVLM